MLHILNLFGRSPFAPLQGHIEKVSDCVHALTTLFAALKEKNYKVVATCADNISKLEHAADLTKNDIRNHIPGNLFLSIDRPNFLEMLSTQDSIADKAEDIAVLLTLADLEFKKAFEDPFFRFLEKNIEAFESVQKIIKELPELAESSFGGVEAQKVRAMIHHVAFLEHEADLLQRDLLKAFFSVEQELSKSAFTLWVRLFETLGAISNLSEKLANCVRMTLDVK